MTRDERIDQALVEAIELLHEAVPDAPFIFIYVAGEEHANCYSYIYGTTSEINTAIKNAMMHSAVICANSMNEMRREKAKVDLSVKERITSDQKLALALLEEAHRQMALEVREEKK